MVNKIESLKINVEVMLSDIEIDIKSAELKNDKVSYLHLRGQRTAFSLVQKRLQKILNEATVKSSDEGTERN